MRYLLKSTSRTFLMYPWSLKVFYFCLCLLGQSHSPASKREKSQEKSHNFQRLIFSNLQKINTKNFNSDPCFFNIVTLGTISPVAHFLLCVNIGRRQTIEAVNHSWSSKVSSGKRFIKLASFQDFRLRAS